MTDYKLNRELRIGNYLMPYHSWLGHVVVTELTDTEIRHTPNSIGAVNDCFVSGIPLTEEWLIKFGFEKESYGDYIIKKESGYEYSAVWKGEGIEIYDNSGLYIISIKHVHTFQNFVYINTGTELTLK